MVRAADPGPEPDLSFLDAADGPPDGAAVLAAVLHDGQRRRRRRRRWVEAGSASAVMAAVLLAVVGISSWTTGTAPGCVGAAASCPPASTAPAASGTASGVQFVHDSGADPALTFWVAADLAAVTREQREFLGTDGLFVTAEVQPGTQLTQQMPVGGYRVGRWSDGAPVGDPVQVVVESGVEVRVSAAELAP